MQLTLSGQLKQFLRVMQGCLFPQLEEHLGPLTGKQRQLIALLELVQIEALVGCWRGGVGRPARHEWAIARAFAAKAVYNLSHTRQLLERLQNDPCLRRICGWVDDNRLVDSGSIPRWQVVVGEFTGDLATFQH